MRHQSGTYHLAPKRVDADTSFLTHVQVQEGEIIRHMCGQCKVKGWRSGTTTYCTAFEEGEAMLGGKLLTGIDGHQALQVAVQVLCKAYEEVSERLM